MGSVCFTVYVTVIRKITVLSLFCVVLVLFLNGMTFCVVTVTVRVTVISVLLYAVLYDDVIITDVSFNRFDEGLKDILRRNKFYVKKWKLTCMHAYMQR